MMKKVVIKLFLGSIVFILTLLALMILFSPYGVKQSHKQKAVVVETEINASSSKLFSYLGESRNARDWSSFVRKIKTLNSRLVADGQVGSKRRCFGKEEGVIWDEEILLVEPNKMRLLNVYNTSGFSLQAENILTEQIYEPISEGKTKLKLSLFFKEGKRNILSELKMYFAAYIVADIFETNLDNIKRINEQVQS